MLQAFNDYQAKPEIDAATHVRRKQIQLAEEISGRKKVYLDTKFWVILRDARLSRSSCSDTSKLLGELEAGVSDVAVHFAVKTGVL